MFKQLKESMRIMSHQIQNINKETEKKILKNQIKILELKSTIAEIKYLLKGLNTRFKQTEERISELEDRSINIIQSEEQRF